MPARCTYPKTVVQQGLWSVPDPSSPGSAVSRGDFPTGYGDARGLTTHAGVMYAVDLDELWSVPDPTDASTAINHGAFPAGMGQVAAVVSDGVNLYTLAQGELWRISDPSNPAGAVEIGMLPSSNTGAVIVDGSLFYVGITGGIGDLWRLQDLQAPGEAQNLGGFTTALGVPDWHYVYRRRTLRHPHSPRHDRRGDHHARRWAYLA